MTDFYDRLEDQLVAAGRRRHAQGHVGRAVAGRGRALVVTAATIAVLVAALAIALPAVLTHDSTSGPVAPPAPPPAGPTVHDTSLAGIRIAVFNATPLPDLGRSVGERLRSRGAYVSIFGNGPAQPGGRTIVRYMPHEGPSARRVANALRVARVDPYDPSGPDGNPPATVRADVIVLVGYDQQP